MLGGVSKTVAKAGGLRGAAPRQAAGGGGSSNGLLLEIHERATSLLQEQASCPIAAQEAHYPR